MPRKHREARRAGRPGQVPIFGRLRRNLDYLAEHGPSIGGIRSFKNRENYHRLREDPAYRLVKKSRWLHNGFAVFERTI
jgi:hypothetical protein